jgi:hypothetical protein
MFAFRDGAVEAIGHDEDGDPAAALVDEWQRRGGRAGTDARVFHAGALGLAQQVRSQLGPPVGPPARFSPAMTLHTGVGLVGIAWLSSPA